ncbi:hypothetical protein GWI33_003007 [Rhynchophorus ferrugineus]|uniref:Uncharacterized protein n=1 Tax=Rhynchophorus ferrugineus TaxID=354439 RepID=A0A834IY53_RHYFE|nr:hypothetical protein GWI33_003007 [Rhynchophorus ferrugineus]
MKLIIALSTCILLCGASSSYGPAKEVRVDGDERVMVKCPKVLTVFARPRSTHNGIKIIVKEPNKYLEYDFIDGDKKLVHRTFVSDHQHLDEDEQKMLDEERAADSHRHDHHGRVTNDDSQMTVISDIFRRYRGVVSDHSFCLLLNELKRAASSGRISELVYTTLENRCGHCNGSAGAEIGVFSSLDTEVQREGATSPVRDRQDSAGSSIIQRILQIQRAVANAGLGEDDEIRHTSPDNSITRKAEDIERLTTHLQDRTQQLQSHLKLLEREIKQLYHRNTVMENQGQGAAHWLNDIIHSIEHLRREEEMVVQEERSILDKIQRFSKEIITEARSLEKEIDETRYRRGRYL